MKTAISMVRLLAISGSLRAASSNTALLRAASMLAPDHSEVTVYDGLGALPHFNPDVERAGSLPASVSDLRAKVEDAGGLLLSCPEYAHGVPGTFKNALDWLVGGEEFVGKPVALLNASPRATHAQASLKETVTVMSGRIIDAASITVPLLGQKLDAEGIARHPGMANSLRGALAAFARAIEGHRHEQMSTPNRPDAE